MSFKPYSQALEDFRRQYFTRALRETGGVTAAAQACGLHRSHVHLMIRRYGIKHARKRGTGNSQWQSL